MTEKRTHVTTTAHRPPRLLASAAAIAAIIGATLIAPPPSEAAAIAPLGQTCQVTPLSVDATPVALATGGCRGVRPGAMVRTSIGICTMNFLFTGTDGERYVGTAGHCLIRDPGETKRFTDPKVFDVDGAHVGDAVYAVKRGYGADYSPIIDFALIRLNAAGAAVATPEICHFGGPVGMDRVLGAGEIVHHYGNGSVIRDVVPGRTGVTFGAGLLGGEYTFEYTGDVGAGGDSGSPVIDHDGNAVGVLVAGVDLANTKPYYPFHGGTPNIVTHLDYHLARAERALGIDLSLETAGTAPLA